MARTNHMGINLILMGYHGKRWEIKAKLRNPAKNLGISLWINLGIKIDKIQSVFQ